MGFERRWKEIEGFKRVCRYLIDEAREMGFIYASSSRQQRASG
jgi:hypothetical protein